MSKQAMLTPIALSDAQKVGRRRFWKQVLPETSINYDGQKIDFDKPFHLDLSKSFKTRAFDQVPVVFADARNGHNMDPRNFGGDVLDMEYRGPGKDGGTWALIEADREAARAIKRNPKLGVSARIRQGVEKADGRFFNRAIEHVLLTMNPRVTGMSPWQAVDLAEDTDTEVVDLTAQHYEEGTPMGKGTTKTRRGSRRQIDLSALSDEEFNRLLDLAQTVVEDPADLDEDLDDDLVDEVDDDEEEETPPQPRRKKSKVKTTKVVERESEDDDPDADEDLDSGDADLSDRVIRREEVSQFGQMRIDLAARDWQTRKDAYLRDGVPAFLLDLAEPVLSQPDKVTLDLADSDEEFDVSETVGKMLDGVKRIVDLTGEIGTSIDLTVDEEEQAEADALLEEWNTNYSA